MTGPSEPALKQRPPGLCCVRAARGCFIAGKDFICTATMFHSQTCRTLRVTPFMFTRRQRCLPRLPPSKNAFHGVPHTICLLRKSKFECEYPAPAGAGGLRLRCSFRRRTGARAGGRPARGQESRLLRRGKVAGGDVGRPKGRDFIVQCGERVGTLALAECAARSHTVAQIALRVRSGRCGRTHPIFLLACANTNLGVPIRDAHELYATASASRYLKVAGSAYTSAHRSGILRLFAESCRPVAALVRELRSMRHRIDYVDVEAALPALI